jgi:hypothetical protein
MISINVSTIQKVGFSIIHVLFAIVYHHVTLLKIHSKITFWMMLTLIEVIRKHKLNVIAHLRNIFKIMFGVYSNF